MHALFPLPPLLDAPLLKSFPHTNTHTQAPFPNKISNKARTTMHSFQLAKVFPLLVGILLLVMPAHAQAFPPCIYRGKGRELDLIELIKRSGCRYVTEAQVHSDQDQKWWYAPVNNGEKAYHGDVRKASGDIHLSVDVAHEWLEIWVLIQASGNETFWLFSYESACYAKEAVSNYSEIKAVKFHHRDPNYCPSC
jgi:hypothetical protein